MAAQHQHYVSKLLLRGFLSKNENEARRSQVRVFDLDRKESFPTSIDNIMGERRFNEWWIDDDTIATIEPATTQIESGLAPLIKRIRAEKRLEITSENIANLALLMAFQFLRTKKMRLLPERFNQQLFAHVQRMGLDPANVDGLIGWDEESLKLRHVKQQVRSLAEITRIMIDKVFFLMTAPAGKCFYLGDHPVVLHSDEERRGVLRGLGVGVPYIQIYLPISHDVLLCAYDRAVLGSLIRARDVEMNLGISEGLKLLTQGKISADQMRGFVQNSKQHDEIGSLIDTIRAGEPVACHVENVDAYNSLQVFIAHRFVVDPLGEFDVVGEMIAEREASKQREQDGAA